MTIELDDAFDSYQHEHWLALAEDSLSEGKTLESLSTATLDGLTIEPLYSHRPTSDGPSVNIAAPVSPSQAPASRTGRVWDNRVAIWVRTPALANEASIHALEGGATSIELHLGDQSACSFTDLPDVLNGVYLDAAAVSLRASGVTGNAADALMDVWDAAGIAGHEAKGAFNLDPVGDHLRGLTTDSFSLNDALQALQDFVERTTGRYPEVPAVLVDGCCHHNAGATAVQELTAVLATGSLYLEALKGSSLDPVLISKTVQLQMSADANTLMGVVKLRSLKMLWQHLLQQLGLPVIEPGLTVETSRRHLSTRDPWVNHLRNTAAVSAAAFVNADTIIVHPHNVIDGSCLDDEALGLRVARNLPIILSEESRLTDVQDPFAGAYAIEHLCQDLCTAVWAALSEYKAANVWFDSVESGRWRDAVHQSHVARGAQLDSSAHIMVGVNRYVSAVAAADTAAVAASTQSPAPSSVPAFAPAFAPGSNTDRPSTLLPVRDAETCEEQSA